MAAAHGLTTKAVRDIWNLRTWRKVTMPLWTEEDRQLDFDKKLCRGCRTRGVHLQVCVCVRACVCVMIHDVRCICTHVGGYVGGTHEVGCTCMCVCVCVFVCVEMW
jgi:hypothetical protein